MYKGTKNYIHSTQENRAKNKFKYILGKQQLIIKQKFV